MPLDAPRPRTPGCRAQVALDTPDEALARTRTYMAIDLLLLAAADQTRCPVAIGCERMRPFYAWVVGVVSGITFCQMMTGETRTTGYSWVMWGSIAEVVKWWYKSNL